MAKKPETKFKEKIIARLKTFRNVWFVKIQQIAIRGIPDLILCVDGMFMAVELKARNKAKIDPLQEKTIKDISKARGVAMIISPENRETLFDYIKLLGGKETEQ